MENTGSRHRHTIPALVMFALCIFAEVFVCNANSFRVMNHAKYEQKTYSPAQIEITNADVNPAGVNPAGVNPAGVNPTSVVAVYRSGYGSSVFIRIRDIDTHIGTVYADFAIPDNVLKYVVCYTDEANTSFYRSFEREYAKGVDRTKWFTCYFIGKSKEIIIRLDNLEDGYTFALNELQINRPVPFHFSVVRFLAMFALVSLIYAVRKTEFFMSREKGTWHNIALAGIFVTFFAISAVIYNNSAGDISMSTMYNRDFTDALIKGRLDLDIEVSDSLKALENPYDTSVRETQGVDYPWDTAYYNGKYYCYFGVVPALLFFVPYKLVTGEYLQCNIVVMAAYCIYMLFLDIIFIRIVRRAVPDVQFGVEFAAMAILNAAANVFYFASEPSFYMVLYAVGLMFVATGFCCFTFWYTGKRKNRLLLFAGAACLSLAVGCRPPLLMYTFLIIPFGIRVIREKKRESIADMAVLLVPYIVIGGALAAYNYMRFDSILEFGTKYQLTAQDQLHISNTIYEVPVMLWLGFFQPLNFSAIFPYVNAPDSATNYAGSFFTGSGITSLLGQAPFLMLLFAPAAWRRWNAGNSAFSRIALSFSAVTGGVMLILLFLNSGVEWRYTSEIAPILCTAAALLAANIIKSADREKSAEMMTFLLMVAFYSFAVSFLRAIAGPFGYTLKYHPEFYYTLERAFSFWK